MPQPPGGCQFQLPALHLPPRHLRPLQFRDATDLPRLNLGSPRLNLCPPRGDIELKCAPCRTLGTPCPPCPECPPCPARTVPIEMATARMMEKNVFIALKYRCR